MGVFFTAVALSITLVILFPNIAQGSVPFQLYVLGNSFEIGTRNFAFFESSFNSRIVCYTPWKVETDVTILKRGENIENGRFRHNANNAGSYSCHIAAKILGKNKAYFSLEIVSYLQIVIIQLGVSLCGTSAGDLGYISERARLYCTDNAGGIEWNNTGSTVNYVSLSERELSRVSCGLKDTDENWEEACRIYPGRLLESLQLKIDPKIFTDSVATLNFTCTSSPPRLIFWEVLGSHGDILEANYGGVAVPVNTSITISQRPGYTTLKIEEGTVGANGIHTVRCFTYDTLTVVAGARVKGMTATVGDLDSDQNNATETPNTAVSQSNKTIGSIAVIATLVAVVLITIAAIVVMYCKIVNLKLQLVTAGESRVPNRDSQQAPQMAGYATRIYGNSSFSASAEEYNYIDPTE